MTNEADSHVANSVAYSPEKYATDFNDVFARLKEATQARTDTELAHCLGLKQSSISSAKTKKDLPPSWIIEIAKRFNVSSDWILFGVGGKALSGASVAPEPGQNEAEKTPSQTLGAGSVPGEVDILRQENKELRQDVRELRQENRELHEENKALLRENGDLRVELAELKARAAPVTSTPSESARKIA